MEIFELRYFLGVAQTENIRRASEKLRVSPGSLSKAISRIEGELGVRLFSREGRGIHLTDQGRYLKGKAVEILRLEEAARVEIAGSGGVIQCVIVGPEVLLSQFGLGVIGKIQKKHPNFRIEYQDCADSQAIEKVRQGDAHLGIVSGEVPRELASRILSETEFRAVVGNGHPLYAKARTGQTVAVTDVLKHGFVCPSHPWLGQVGLNQSSDGWRDDQFPRRVEHQTSSLKLLEKIVASGKAIAYLPDYLIKDLELTVLKIKGCPYHCTQIIRLIAHRPKEIGWISQLF